MVEGPEEVVKLSHIVRNQVDHVSSCEVSRRGLSKFKHLLKSNMRY